MSIQGKTMMVFTFCAIIINQALCTIALMHPMDLKKQFSPDGIIESSLANFGHIEYGTSSLGQIIIPLENKDGCQ